MTQQPKITPTFDNLTHLDVFQSMLHNVLFTSARSNRYSLYIVYSSIQFNLTQFIQCLLQQWHFTAPKSNKGKDNSLMFS